MANCLLCKLREGCGSAYSIAGDCSLFQFSDTNGCVGKIKDYEVLKETARQLEKIEGCDKAIIHTIDNVKEKEHCYQFREKVIVKPKTNPEQEPYTFDKVEKIFCEQLIDKIKDSIEEELDFLLNERENHIGKLPIDMFTKIVRLKNMLMVSTKIFDYVGYTIDVGDYIKKLDDKIIELGG